MAVARNANSRLLPTDLRREMVAKFFRALGDPARSAAEFLLHQDTPSANVVENVGLSQGRLRPSRLPVRCGYVVARRAGRFAYYRVADTRVAELVTLARSLAAENAPPRRRMRIGR